MFDLARLKAELDQLKEANDKANDAATNYEVAVGNAASLKAELDAKIATAISEAQAANDTAAEVVRGAEVDRDVKAVLRDRQLEYVKALVESMIKGGDAGEDPTPDPVIEPAPPVG